MKLTKPKSIDKPVSTVRVVAPENGYRWFPPLPGARAALAGRDDRFLGGSSCGANSDLAQMWLHDLCEGQQVIEILLNDCLDDVQVQVSIPMYREVAKSDHLLELVA